MAAPRSSARVLRCLAWNRMLSQASNASPGCSRGPAHPRAARSHTAVRPGTRACVHACVPPAVQQPAGGPCQACWVIVPVARGGGGVIVVQQGVAARPRAPPPQLSRRPLLVCVSRAGTGAASRRCAALPPAPPTCQQCFGHRLQSGAAGLHQLPARGQHGRLLAAQRVGLKVQVHICSPPREGGQAAARARAGLPLPAPRTQHQRS
jgi:hypothetical protein